MPQKFPIQAMEPRKICIVRFFVLVTAYSAITFFTLSDARYVVQFSNFEGPIFSRNSIHKPLREQKLSSHIYLSRAESNGLGTGTGTGTPFPLPPFGSIAPLSSPPYNNIPAPFCIYPPSTPDLPFQSPPHSTTRPPAVSPGPNPPRTGFPTPPPYGLSPPKLVPRPPVYQPPPPHKKPQFAIWCVAKPTVPDSIIQEAMDYACGSGADCKAIQPNGLCFQPNSLFAHASYAFNSYWQNTKVGGGTCDFGGTAMLVTTDPSFDDCRFTCN